MAHTARRTGKVFWIEANAIATQPTKGKNYE
jgi:hypothetical protein